jgi:hypothetical protein
MMDKPRNRKDLTERIRTLCAAVPPAESVAALHDVLGELSAQQERHRSEAQPHETALQRALDARRRPTFLGVTMNEVPRWLFVTAIIMFVAWLALMASRFTAS